MHQCDWVTMAMPNPVRGRTQMSGSIVYINTYGLNPLFGFLNRSLLRDNEMGIFHCGVEIHSTEFSFAFDPNMHETGVRVHTPKKFGRYKFCESIYVGWTDLS